MNSGHSNGIKVVGYFDCYGGGQVVGRERIAYVGHIAPPHGTSIIDVSDPSKPRELAKIAVTEGTLSHKVRVENGVMLVNREIFPIGRKDPSFRGGLEVYDVSRPADPKRITSFSCRGMHRFTFDGRYVYGSPEMDGHLRHIVGIIDFQDPARPPRDAGCRRGRRAARPGLTLVPVDRRHHRRNTSDSVRELPGRRGGRLAEAGLHRFAPVLRRGAQHGNSHRVVCAWAENRRHRQSARPARDRIVHAAGAGRRDPGAEQRRLLRRPRPDLPHRPHARSAHPGADLTAQSDRGSPLPTGTPRQTGKAMNLLVRNARLRGRDQLVDIGIEQGRIAAVAPDLAASAAETIDAAGDLVVPGFVNLHLHADKALLGEVMRPNVSGTLPEAIEITNDFKRKYDPQEVARRAGRAIETGIRN